MEHLIMEIIAKAVLIVGALCLIVLFIELIVWGIRTIVRNVTDIRYASKVKYYLEDAHRRIADYEARIRHLEGEILERRQKDEV
ncbi:MAG: hypothetical protein IJS15_07900 [Victivallales bacterium]|nr:hypothetical protein [Victivallales bacterium]